MNKISAVINTFNDSQNIKRCIDSVKDFADEIIVVDMMSTDSTIEIAKKSGAVVFEHKKLAYVEPARNFAISKAKNEWVILLDPDEEISKSLKLFLKKEIINPQADYYRIPRKNIIFKKWIKHTGWWPDLNIRFFKKNHVSWNQVIHSVPMTSGRGYDLPLKEEYAILHRSYYSIEDYINRMNRYTSIQAEELDKKGVKFDYVMLFIKPLSEFLRRYFSERGYKDGIHGLSLSLLQSLSELVLYSKLWQKQGFKRGKIGFNEIESEFNKIFKDVRWWIVETKIRDSKNVLNVLWLKIKRKLKFQ